MVQHKDLTGLDLHEPKGADTASGDLVYVSDGNGSGTWQKIGTNQINTSGLPGLVQYVEGATHSNINSTKTAYTIQVRAGKLSVVSGVIDATITTDTTINILKNGSLQVATYTIPAGSTAGFSFTVSVPSLPSFAAGDYISITSNGTGSTPAILILRFLFNYS